MRADTNAPIFVLRLRFTGKPGADGFHKLRALLKQAAI